MIEDEPGIVDFVSRGLEAEGFVVEAALDGVEGERLGVGGSFDAVVLDLMLPERARAGGAPALRRARPTMPVIVLTARGELEDRVAGLEAGAVDYLVKPFSLAELVARLRAQLRVVAQASASTLGAEGIEVDLLTRQVIRGGRAVPLSTTEFELLVYLLRHRGRALSREQILSAVWGYEHDPATNVVDVYVGYLRRKLAAGGDPAPIFTVRIGRLPPRRRAAERCARCADVSARPACAGAWLDGSPRSRSSARRSPSSPSIAAPARSCDSQIDTEIAGYASDSRTASRARTPTRRSAPTTRRARTSRDQPFAASSIVLFVTIPGARTVTNRPELFSGSDVPTTARRSPSRSTRTSSRAGC